jgi:hypothetical protein
MASQEERCRCWQLESCFMVFTAYLDESGTHAGAELSAMAGFVGDERQWRKFEKRAAKLFKRYGVEVFHTIDIKRSCLLTTNRGCGAMERPIDLAQWVGGAFSEGIWYSEHTGGDSTAIFA